ncbi:MAG: hypothetical protein ACI8SE_001102 [Bacteroidia bacterium]|jgi:hypothetical protein
MPRNPVLKTLSRFTITVLLSFIFSNNVYSQTDVANQPNAWFNYAPTFGLTGDIG